MRRKYAHVPSWVRSKQHYFFVDNLYNMSSNALSWHGGWRWSSMAGVLDYLCFLFVVTGHIQTWCWSSVFAVTLKHTVTSMFPTPRNIRYDIAVWTDHLGFGWWQVVIKFWRDKVTQRHSKLSESQRLHDYSIVPNLTASNSPNYQNTCRLSSNPLRKINWLIIWSNFCTLVIAARMVLFNCM